ncbi:MAG: type II secretion system F family protein, partial [Vibrio splendidus]
QISTALIYPGFVAAISLLVCAILMVNVAPEIVAMFELSGRPLPKITQVILGVSNWIQDYFLAICAVGVFVFTGWVAAATIPRLRRTRDRLFLRIPFVGRFMRLSASVQYLRTLALVLGSKNTVPSAVENASQVLAVDTLRLEGEAVSEAIRQGQTLSKALEHLSIVPPVARQLIAAGEVSVRIANMTERSAILVENGLSNERKRIAALLEPILMMLVGAFVLTVVLAVLLPIFDLQSVVAN